MGMPWLQTKEYVCTGCGVRLLHDRMHNHVSFHCPARPGARPEDAAGGSQPNAANRLTSVSSLHV